MKAGGIHIPVPPGPVAPAASETYSPAANHDFTPQMHFTAVAYDTSRLSGSPGGGWMWIIPDFSPGRDIILTISPGGASFDLLFIGELVPSLRHNEVNRDYLHIKSA